MPYFRKKQHFPVVGLVLSLRTGMAKLGFFALISLHPPKFGNCFKPRRFLLGVRKRNNSGLKKLLPGVRGARAEQISVHLPAPSACPCPIPVPPLPGQSRGLKEWSFRVKCHKNPAGIISPRACQIPGFTRKNPKNRFFFSPKSRISQMQPEPPVSCLFGGFWGTTNVPEDMQGRWLLLPDTGAVSGSGASCSPPIYFGGGRKAFSSLEVSKGWVKPLAIPRRSKARHP